MQRMSDRSVSARMSFWLRLAGASQFLAPSGACSSGLWDAGCCARRKTPHRRRAHQGARLAGPGCCPAERTGVGLDAGARCTFNRRRWGKRLQRGPRASIIATRANVRQPTRRPHRCSARCGANARSVVPIVSCSWPDNDFSECVSPAVELCFSCVRPFPSVSLRDLQTQHGRGSGPEETCGGQLTAASLCPWRRCIVIAC